MKRLQVTIWKWKSPSGVYGVPFFSLTVRWPFSVSVVWPWQTRGGRG